MLARRLFPHRNGPRSSSSICYTVAELIVISALAREESRGAHYRNDFSRRDDARFAKHSVVRSGKVYFETMEMPALAR